MHQDKSKERTIKIQDLDLTLDEAEELLSALRSGEIDGVVISRSDDVKIFTLQSADRPYRLMIESLREGAVTFGPDGSILFCNPFFAEMVQIPSESLIGMNFYDFLSKEDRGLFESMVEENRSDSVEASLITGPKLLSVKLTFGSIREDDIVTNYVVITDLADYHQRQELAAKYKVEEALRIEAEEMNRKKDQFLAMLAHELRGPLAPIRNAARLIRQSSADDSKLMWARDIIDHQVDHLARLADDLLDVAKITQGKVTLQKQIVDLKNIVTHAFETSQPQIEARHHRLHISVPEEPILVQGDPTRLAQIVSNLLTNAAKFTPPEGQIWLTVERKAKHVEISVRDSGQGISSNMLPHIFDLFVQADSSLDRTESGLGIGLTLVRSLVEMHHGEVFARSDGPGRGSEFIVRLPIAASDIAVQKEQHAEEMKKSPAYRVLVVDDSLITAASMAMVLELFGHNVSTAQDGPEALALCKSFKPEIVLLDIGLPGMDGFEVAKHIRNELSMNDATIIAISGYGRTQDMVRSKEAGFDHHLVKPVNTDSLQTLIVSLREKPLN